jgi:hypothetical protein
VQSAATAVALAAHRMKILQFVETLLKYTNDKHYHI